MPNNSLLNNSVLNGLNEPSRIIQLESNMYWNDIEVALKSLGWTLGWGTPMVKYLNIQDIFEKGAYGMRSSLYGSSVENCISISGKNSNGEKVISRTTPRSAAGPDWKHLWLGGNARIGTIDYITCKIYPLPIYSDSLIMRWDSWESAVKAMANALQRGARPAVAFLYFVDNSWVSYWSFEGLPAIVHAHKELSKRIFTTLIGSSGKVENISQSTSKIDEIEQKIYDYQSDKITWSICHALWSDLANLGKIFNASADTSSSGKTDNKMLNKEIWLSNMRHQYATLHILENSNELSLEAIKQISILSNNGCVADNSDSSVLSTSSYFWSAFGNKN